MRGRGTKGLGTQGLGTGPGRTTRPPLTIHRSPTGFVLHDPALLRLAGFDAVPLPFTPEADPAEVLAHLRRLNPHRPVRLDDALPLVTPADRAPQSPVPAPPGAKSPVPCD